MFLEKKTIIFEGFWCPLIFDTHLMLIPRPCELNRRSWVSWWSPWPVVIWLGSTVGTWANLLRLQVQPNKTSRYHIFTQREQTYNHWLKKNHVDFTVSIQGFRRPSESLATQCLAKCQGGGGCWLGRKVCSKNRLSTKEVRKLIYIYIYTLTNCCCQWFDLRFSQLEKIYGKVSGFFSMDFSVSFCKNLGSTGAADQMHCGAHQERR